MANKITMDMLIRHRACSDYRDKFAKVFPDGTALVTVDLAVRMATEFPWEWAADAFLTSENRKAWYVANAAFSATYNTEMNRARATRAEAVQRDGLTQAYEAYRQASDQLVRALFVAQATKFAELFLAQPETTGRDDYLQILNDYSVYNLASMADVSGPDHDGSRGAKFLDDLRNSVAEAIKNGASPDTLRDESGTLADEAVTNAESRSTYYKWLAFADLGAWQEDADEIGGLGDINDLDMVANRALWLIADRLVGVIANEYEEHVSRETPDTDSDHAWREVASTADDDH